MKFKFSAALTAVVFTVASMICSASAAMAGETTVDIQNQTMEPQSFGETMTMRMDVVVTMRKPLQGVRVLLLFPPELGTLYFAYEKGDIASALMGEWTASCGVDVSIGWNLYYSTLFPTDNHAIIDVVPCRPDFREGMVEPYKLESVIGVCFQTRGATGTIEAKYAIVQGLTDPIGEIRTAQVTMPERPQAPNINMQLPEEILVAVDATYSPNHKGQVWGFRLQTTTGQWSPVPSIFIGYTKDFAVDGQVRDLLPVMLRVENTRWVIRTLEDKVIKVIPTRVFYVAANVATAPSRGGSTNYPRPPQLKYKVTSTWGQLKSKAVR